MVMMSVSINFSKMLGLYYNHIEQGPHFYLNYHVRLVNE